jgi:hypothetical protein
MGRKKLSALFLKYGVSVCCIPGSTAFVNHLGTKISVGVCCWYFGNMKEAKPGVIQFGMFSEGNVFVSDEVESDDDAEDEEDFGITNLFKSN